MAETYGKIDRIRCTDLEAGRHLEWMVSNGCGGYASSTVNQMLSRRYHGLLVAAMKSPVDRFVLLAKLDATIIIDGLTYELATNDFPEAVHPHGYRLLESFVLHPTPTWLWRTGKTLLEQTLCMVKGENTTFVRYRLLEGADRIVLTVRPLCTSRHYHRLTHYREIGPPNVESEESHLTFHWSGDRPAWHLSHNGKFKSRSDWYYDYVLAIERERGYGASQDLFMPGVIITTLQRGDAEGLVVAASTNGRLWTDHAKVFTDAERYAPTAATADDSGDRSLLKALIRSADDFPVLYRKDRKTILAGYPWFGDWGRDTFISLPGLCLVTGRFGDARDIILAFAEHLNKGLIPNRFPNACDPPQYHTADASLWYIHALHRYLVYTNDWPFARERMFQAVADILDAYQRGTHFDIHVCEDGLLFAGSSGNAVTWMDARLPDRAITPRIGKPVELNALWYNALRIASKWARRLDDPQREQQWRAMAEQATQSFNRRFWNEQGGCLYDVVDVDGQANHDDPAVRPNQLFAISLSHPILDQSRWKAVVDVCERTLWTPMGLRTLSPNDPQYHGRYSGDVIARDEAYHQGTVWPWLLGPFVSAYVKTFGQDCCVKDRAMTFLAGLLPHLNDAGLGGISEVADGDPPHAPGGCPWQAWSTAEPLRALCEDIYSSHPPVPKEKQSDLTYAI